MEEQLQEDSATCLDGAVPTTLEQANEPSYLTEVRRWVDLCLLFTMFLVLLSDVTSTGLLLFVFSHYRDFSFLAAGVFFILLSSLVVSITLAVEISAEETGRRRQRMVATCVFVANFPLSLSVIVYQFAHCLRYAKQLCSSQAAADMIIVSRREWLLTKLMLQHSLIHSGPLLVINGLHMLCYDNSHIIQYISASVSFVSLTLGVVAYEKTRKQRSRDVTSSMAGSQSFGLLALLCVLLYKMVMLLARVISVTNYLYYFGKWLIVLFVPHLMLVFIFMVCVHPDIWATQGLKVVTLSLFSVFTYVPVTGGRRRHDGEVLLYYALFAIENVIMVAVPHNYPPTSGMVATSHLPSTHYYNTVIMLALFGTALGLALASLYYFFAHRSATAVREANVGWLIVCCTSCTDVGLTITRRSSHSSTVIHSNSLFADNNADQNVNMLRDYQQC